MGEMRAKLLVIGGGPGGYVAAIRAGQLGVDTVLVEAGPLGGTCLNVGCIPSKALIHAAEAFAEAGRHAGGSAFGLRAERPVLDFGQTVAWKDAIVARLNGGVASLLRKSQVRVLRGHAVLLDGKNCAVETDTGPQTVRAEHVLLATGSEPVEPPFLPFGGKVISSTEALSLPEVPGRLAVVGAGYIGLELGTAFAKLGSAVTVIEAAGRILPHYDADLVRPVSRRLQALGVTVLTDAHAGGLSADGAGLTVLGEDGAGRIVPADVVLVAVGRRPRTGGFGLEGLDLEMSGPFVRIDERCATSMRQVWAVGDLTGEPMLAHRAMAQGEMVAEIVAGHRRAFDKAAIPAVCFTDPEIVTAGLSPAAAREAGHSVRVGQFPFAANGRAMTLEAEEGFVRIVARADNNLVLGVQAVGRGVSELATAFGLALEMGARLEDVAATVHAHPTLGEAFQEAALGGLGRALHV
jgi:dihydrolipoamide dehydrogenase